MLARVRERGMATAVPRERSPRFAIAIFFSLFGLLLVGMGVLGSSLMRCFRLVEEAMKRRKRGQKETREDREKVRGGKKKR